MAVYRELADKLIVLFLCSMIFALPFSKSAIEICFSLALLLWAINKILSYIARAPSTRSLTAVNTNFNFPVYLFIASGIISTLVSYSIALSLKGLFFKLLEGAMLYFIIADAINTRKKINMILLFMVLSMALISVDGIFQFVTAKDFIRQHSFYGERWFRMQASFGNPNSLGGWLTVMFPLALCLCAIRDDIWSKIFVKNMMRALTCLLAFCLVMTYSRGAWMGAVLAIFFIGIFKKNKSLIIIVPILILLPFIIPPYIKRHILSLLQLTVSFSIKGRIESITSFVEPIRVNLWREAMAIIKDFPFFGCGLNTYSVVAPAYKISVEGGIYPHNSYLQMAAEMGLVGLTAFVCMVLTLFLFSLDNLTKMKNGFYDNVLIGLLAGLFAFLIHSFFDVNFYMLQLSTMMWFIMGLIVAVQRVALKERHQLEEYSD